ncbi:MAG: hypothetical protein M3081_00825 [Gemmatimonadota bacterium]|nr:hypothetical protein [Gemmatimonadota bacterium]
MADDKNRNIEDPPKGYTTQDVAAAPPPVKRKRRWGLAGVVVAILLIPILVIALWTTIALNWSYSRGERVGYVQKLSRKGYVCPTWEGEMPLVIPNQAQMQPEVFRFSVRSDSIAHAIEAASGRRVALEYEQHRGVPFTCFGETQYFITGIKVVPAQ